MAIAAQLAQLITEKEPKANLLSECSYPLQCIALNAFLVSLSAKDRDCLYADATLGFDRLPYLNDLFAMADQERRLFCKEMCAWIDNDVAAELFTLRKQDRIESEQSRRDVA